MDMLMQILLKILECRKKRLIADARQSPLQRRLWLTTYFRHSNNQS
jgi:hypothetical protein